MHDRNANHEVQQRVCNLLQVSIYKMKRVMIMHTVKGSKKSSKNRICYPLEVLTAKSASRGNTDLSLTKPVLLMNVRLVVFQVSGQPTGLSVLPNVRFSIGMKHFLNMYACKGVSINISDLVIICSDSVDDKVEFE